MLAWIFLKNKKKMKKKVLNPIIKYSLKDEENYQFQK